jgi:hypothetical protein
MRVGNANFVLLLLLLLLLFQIQADQVIGLEVDSQTLEYRMCPISEQMFQLLTGTSLGNII